MPVIPELSLAQCVSDIIGYHAWGTAAIKTSGLSYEEEAASFGKIPCFFWQDLRNTFMHLRFFCGQLGTTR